MTTFPGSPRLLKAGIAAIDTRNGTVEQLIALQYNPETLTRSLQPQAIGEQSGDRSEALRLGGPPVETYKLDAILDAADQLEFPDRNEQTLEHGILPQLAALEILAYPRSADLISNKVLAESGTLEIIPALSPLTVFIWSANRVVPMRLTDFSITEEMFDARLNPLFARISLGFRVLNVNDVGFDHRGGNLYMGYQQRLETLAGLAQGGAFSDFGINAASLGG